MKRFILAVVFAVTAPLLAAGSNPVIDAVKAGGGAALREAVKRRADVNLPEADGMTALHWAVQSDAAESVNLLLRAGANANAATRYGVTPLFLAATNGNADMVQALVKAGANAKAALPSGETVLMTAARAGKPGAVRALILAGADVHATERAQDQNALMWAAIENNGEVVRVLAEAGARLNERSKVLEFPEFKWVTSGMVSTNLPRGGWTALMYSARQGAIDAARALVAAGADPDVADPDGTTALILAIVNTHFDYAAALIALGADPNVADVTGMTALYAAVDVHTLGPMLSRPVPQLTDRLNAADIVRLLLERGARPDPRLKRPILGRHHDSGDSSLGEGTTPLMRAAKSGDVLVVKMLLDAGANPALTQRDYTNALMIAVSGGGRPSEYARPPTEAEALEAIKACLARGVDVNAFNANGQTALHLAAARGANSIVSYLVEQGASLTTRNRQGRTPLEVAMGQGGRGRGGPPVVRESTAALLRELISKQQAAGRAQ